MAQTETATKPRHTCNPNRPGQPLPFGRPDPTGKCAGCLERAAEREAGIPARTNSMVESLQRNARNDEKLAREIREHDCLTSNCGPVCTAFQW